MRPSTANLDPIYRNCMIPPIRAHNLLSQYEISKWVKALIEWVRAHEKESNSFYSISLLSTEGTIQITTDGKQILVNGKPIGFDGKSITLTNDDESSTVTLSTSDNGLTLTSGTNSITITQATISSDGSYNIDLVELDSLLDRGVTDTVINQTDSIPTSQAVRNYVDTVITKTGSANSIRVVNLRAGESTDVQKITYTQNESDLTATALITDSVTPYFGKTIVYIPEFVFDADTELYYYVSSASISITSDKYIRGEWLKDSTSINVNDPDSILELPSLEKATSIVISNANTIDFSSLITSPTFTIENTTNLILNCGFPLTGTTTIKGDTLKFVVSKYGTVPKLPSGLTSSNPNEDFDKVLVPYASYQVFDSDGESIRHRLDMYFGENTTIEWY